MIRRLCMSAKQGTIYVKWSQTPLVFTICRLQTDKLVRVCLGRPISKLGCLLVYVLCCVVLYCIFMNQENL